MVILTEKHYEILALRAEGWTTQRIAEFYGYKPNSMQQLFEKLDRLNGLSVDVPSRAMKFFCKVCGTEVPYGRNLCEEHKRKRKTKEEKRQMMRERYWADSDYRLALSKKRKLWWAKIKASNSPMYKRQLENMKRYRLRTVHNQSTPS